MRDGGHTWDGTNTRWRLFRPEEITTTHVTETVFALENKLNEKISMPAGYVGDYRESAGPTQLINSGGLYRLSPKEQIDVHVTFGLKHNSPSHIVDVGYSFRIDVAVWQRTHSGKPAGNANF